MSIEVYIPGKGVLHCRNCKRPWNTHPPLMGKDFCQGYNPSRTRFEPGDYIPTQASREKDKELMGAQKEDETWKSALRAGCAESTREEIIHALELFREEILGTREKKTPDWREQIGILVMGPQFTTGKDLHAAIVGIVDSIKAEILKELSGK